MKELPAGLELYIQINHKTRQALINQICLSLLFVGITMFLCSEGVSSDEKTIEFLKMTNPGFWDFIKLTENSIIMTIDAY